MHPPPVGYYFMANIFFRALSQEDAARETNRQADTENRSVDIRFQRISGFRVNMAPLTLEEGGQNTFVHRLPTRYNYENLVLERGLVLDSELNSNFAEALTTFRFTPCTILVSLLDENDNPVTAWAFFDAYPVNWSSSDLDANANTIVIETLELAYSRFQRMKL